MARTDDDSWDLATSVGATATMVAAGRARATRTGLIDDPFAEPLVRAVGVDFFTAWAAGESHADEVDVAGLTWGMQPMTDLLAARTRFIDDFLTEAAATGIGQVVLLASGLDARGYRMSWPGGLTVFEIDQPQVLAFKTETLAGLGAAATATVRTVGIDLRHDWPAALRAAGFDGWAPTAWVAEGLLAFLPPPAQDGLLDAITALSAPGSRLVTEMFLHSPQSQQIIRATHRRWYECGLTVALDDLSYPGDRHDVDAYLTERGWRARRVDLAQVLAASGLPAPSRADGPAPENYYTVAERLVG